MESTSDLTRRPYVKDRKRLAHDMPVYHAIEFVYNVILHAPSGSLRQASVDKLMKLQFYSLALFWRLVQMLQNILFSSESFVF